MSEKSIVFEKSKHFALRIVKLYKHLSESKRETVMSKQILCCGTSVGANLAEAVCAISRADFLNKAYIAFKECNETRYWLDLLKESQYLTESEHCSISADANELFMMLSSITKTMRLSSTPNSQLPTPNF